MSLFAEIRYQITKPKCEIHMEMYNHWIGRANNMNNMLLDPGAISNTNLHQRVGDKILSNIGGQFCLQ